MNHYKPLVTAAAVLLASVLSSAAAVAKEDPIRVGIMLPFSGVYAALGDAGRNGLKLALEQNADKLHGRTIEYIEMDTEARPDRAPEIATALMSQKDADFIVGPVHSGVAMGMLKVLRNKKPIMIIPNAGANVATGPWCAPNVFRTSFSAWQPSYPMGQVALDKGYKKVVTMSWNYSFGKESLDAFEESFSKGGGKVLKKILVPFPKTEFQSYITEIAALKPDAVFVFFAGGGAVKFVKDYNAMGLSGKIPLLGSGFLTEGTLAAQGNAAEGIVTGLHYADELDIPANHRFRAAYAAEFGKDADLYGVQGFDTGLLIAQAVDKLNGNISDRDALIQVMEDAVIPSPRGEFHFSKAHNPIQTIYLRTVENGVNKVTGIAAEALEDPARGCRSN
ncbi:MULTISPECIES: ABC transporter substrate-binding protein [unclassified Oceanobacter]|uniref:ABC transporter substrate-binding protein n=1 Tax=unclassified Oceanobacter TaxID=2620260 RepID=UPI0026E44106|nr:MULTISPECIES: ABC transporter substrate-binding protein [unclassified Oceanobacter]MDO6683379.1 ABC transporter substrate-binding protein [Oceanobacter sp. 5_MG-2023]MDP2506358.1 ABC transporter substrate-binding protein [Oceanobacter sp. 3_MG-2023]MDP2549322.1 ABC transporter substrate-binding protein [Oceanobacter sp. 4_MG-2023]MDP2609936.1 ABC transporter substrate-binding protein [Oceanobacter sp. 1_MG-2023]MDP2613182.1 ABC transporter substrate-binding protein [Oceanobacter sp. 2_MG-20